MTILAVDTETSGLWRSDIAPDDERQPHVVQIALLLMDNFGAPLQSVNLVVRPQGYVIPPEVSRIHGITTERAERTGVSLRLAVAAWTNLRALADLTIGYNFLSFDLPILDQAMRRAGAPHAHHAQFRYIDVKELADPIMRLPPTERMRRTGYGNKTKAPKLSEAYEYFVGRPIEGAHDAMVDVLACAAVFFEIERLEWAALTRGDER